jgi:hypothetical protein
MKLNFIIFYFYFSCLSLEVISQTAVSQNNIIVSSEAAALKNHFESQIAEPFNISTISLNHRLDFTSGGLPKRNKENYCDSTSNGFYGRYNIIDRNITDTFPVVGHIDIFKKGKMSDWKSDDADQKIWEISLSSDILTVWDSVRVGLPRKDIVEFGQAHNGFCIKKGDFYYSCDFNNFGAVFIFKSDTLKRLTVTRSCNKTEFPK